MLLSSCWESNSPYTSVVFSRCCSCPQYTSWRGGSCCCYTVSFITIQTGDHKKLISDSSPPHPRITCRPDMYRYVQVCTNVLPLFTSPICRAKRHKSHQLVCWANETASHRLLRDANEQLIRRPARGERERDRARGQKSRSACGLLFIERERETDMDQLYLNH